MADPQTRTKRPSKRAEIRIRGVKRYTVQGVTYTYHTASGARLPNYPYSDPRFRAAFDAAQFAHETQTESLDRWGMQEHPMSLNLQSHPLTKTPHHVAFSVPDLIRFVVTGKPDQVLIYHSGNLALDGSVNDLVRDKQRYALLAKEFGILSLQQARIADGAYQYYAIRTDGSLRGLPQNAIYGRITPDEFAVLTAINERQASLSVSRVIRDTLSITDSDASAWRNSMIRRGWLTNGRPPELTQLGLSLLN